MVILRKLIICILIFTFFAVRFWFGAPSEKINVYNHKQDKVIKMEFERYIMNVLAAEMPASFEKEALKAQAVAARTYTAQKIASGWDDPYHKGANICTDSTHCQAYRELAELGENAKKIYSAVDETVGEVALWNGELIRAVFHSASHGQTERSADVWVEDLPYLQSVASPWDSACPDYIHEVNFSADEVCHILDVSSAEISKTIRSSAGGVMDIVIGGKEMKGTEVRSKLNLRSTCFAVTEKDGILTFCTEGYEIGRAHV